MGWLDRFRRRQVPGQPSEEAAAVVAVQQPEAPTGGAPVMEAAAEAPPEKKEIIPPHVAPPPVIEESPPAPVVVQAPPAREPLPQETSEASEKVGLLTRFKSGLSRTRTAMVGKVRGVFSRHRAINDALYDDLLEALLEADVGYETAEALVERTRTLVKESRITEPAEVEAALQEAVREIVTQYPLAAQSGKRILLVLGVNGVGKTTTIAKLAHHYKNGGEKVLLAAADTFRAGAIEQLRRWADRVGVDIVTSQEGQDPSAVVYQAIARFHKEGHDLLIVDTAGRLHTRTPLMDELKKMTRVALKQAGEVPLHTLLVLDAHTGQNAIRQAESFKEACDVQALALTKLDGTPKGGAVVAVCHRLELPVAWVGLGEKMEDLRPFDGERFAKALFEGFGEGPPEEEEDAEA